MDLNNYLSPTRARAVPEGTKERELVSNALRNLWHTIFDPCPSLVELAPPDGKFLMEPFLDWAQGEGLSMSWTLHVHLLRWLLKEPEFNQRIDESHKRALIAAAAQRWAVSNMADIRNIGKNGILIHCQGYAGYVVGARKASAVDKGPQLKLLRLDGEPPDLDSAYAFSTAARDWEHGRWRAVPA